MRDLILDVGLIIVGLSVCVGLAMTASPILHAKWIKFNKDKEPEIIDDLSYFGSEDAIYFEGKPIKYVVATQRKSDGMSGVLFLSNTRQHAEAYIKRKRYWGWVVADVKQADIDFLNRRKPHYHYQPYLR